MDMSQYLEIFIEETKEHLQGLNQSLLELEKNPNDTAMLNEIFRVAHTLKGMSSTMGYTKMSKLTHDMENVLHVLRSGKIKISTNLLDLLFKCLDALENYLNNIITNSNEGNEQYTDIINSLVSYSNENKSENKSENFLETNDDNANIYQKQELRAIENKTGNFNLNQYEQNLVNKAIDLQMKVYKMTIVFSQGCVLKSARAFIVFQCIERFCEIIKSQPVVEDIEDEKFDFEFTLVVISKESKEYAQKEVLSIAEVEKVIVTDMEYRIINTLENLSVKMDEYKNSIEPTQSDEDASLKNSSMNPKTKTGKTVRVDIDRLGVLMNLVSELIIIKTRLEGLDGIERTQSYNEAVEYLERITTSLHDAVMKVRMMPIETVFNRFPRMIRDISKELNKEIVLITSGEETELDRTVIDEIGDPLIHLLRNSADHGIETTKRRKELGKDEAGHIYLRAYQDGNNVVIEVEDDGEGINVEKVKKKAIENGLISKEIANSLSQKEIVEFLFKPSFSTADKITDLSGRGVGLDVVKTKIEALGGNVEVFTEQLKGSKFTIRLPLTLAIIQALLVLIGKEKYAIPLNTIKEIINISPDKINFVQKQEVILLRDMVVPIVRLDKVLDVPKEDKEVKQLTTVIVKKGDKLTGFIVDSLIGQQEIVIKSLGKLLAGIRSIAGATILGDGNVALIVDVNSLV